MTSWNFVWRGLLRKIILSIISNPSLSLRYRTPLGKGRNLISSLSKGSTQRGMGSDISTYNLLPKIKIMNLQFLNREQITQVWDNFELPVFVYSEEELTKKAEEFLNFPNAYGLTVRYAMKASPNKNILNIFNKLGIQIDASSAYEIKRAINAWIKSEQIQLTAQELPNNKEEVFNSWIIYNATSLHQLEEYWKIRSWSEVSVRINPWLWSWWTNRTNVWWPSSSFWIWYEYINEVLEIAKKYDLKITKIHTHIGSWSDPIVWSKVAKMSLDIVEKFTQVHTLNLGWGFKIWRMPDEITADLQLVWNQVKQSFINFYEQTWRKLHLEIEPGTYLVANSCSLICEVQDVCDTWSEGNNFIKVNSWMTEITRPSMYWSQHPLFVINNETETKEYIVAGHCCESWDIWTPASWDPEGLATRKLNKASIWDLFVIDWVWAYCSSMSTKNYNSFPEAGEVLIQNDWEIKEIRKRQNVEDIWRNEV